MSPPVNYQVGRPRKHLRTELALIWSIFAVLVQMTLEIFRTPKRFTTNITLVVQRCRRRRRRPGTDPTATATR